MLSLELLKKELVVAALQQKLGKEVSSMSSVGVACIITVPTSQQCKIITYRHARLAQA